MYNRNTCCVTSPLQRYNKAINEDHKLYFRASACCLFFHLMIRAVIAFLLCIKYFLGYF